MTKHVRYYENRAARKARTERAAQRTPLPPRGAGPSPSPSVEIINDELARIREAKGLPPRREWGTLGSAPEGRTTEETDMTVLKPAPVSIRQFTWDAASSTPTGRATLSAEISSTNGLGRVYDDAADEGLTVLGSTREIVFVVTDTHYNTERELTHWDLRSVDGTFAMILWND
jgi:hypothetical protein